MTKVCVVGLGYIGFPTAFMLASKGHEVTGVDVDEGARNRLTTGDNHFDEPGLNELVRSARSSGNLKSLEQPQESDIFIICVPTPFTQDKKPDLSHVESSCKSILPVLRKGNLVILESTVPPNTTKNVVVEILKSSGLEPGSDFFVAYCPERVMPGQIVRELVQNDRIIGGINPESSQKAKELYETFVEGNLYLTYATTAEFVKLIENTFRDTNIALANQLAILAESWGIDVWEAIELANKHPRVNILNPGPGVGGHCIAVDPYFLMDGEANYTEMIEAARRTNTFMPEHVVDMVENILGGAQGIISVFGVAYKGNIGDIRESPALSIIKIAQNRGYSVAVHDPLVGDKFKTLELEEALRDSSCLIIVTDHKTFLDIDPVEAGELMKNRNLFDTRNIMDHEAWIQAGFKVKVLGRSSEF